jgi:hypothetical protein
MKTLRSGCIAGPDGLDLPAGPTLNSETRGENTEVTGEIVGEGIAYEEKK